MAITRFYDFTWTFADGHTVTFSGVSRMFDLRSRLKELKKRPDQRGYAQRLTNKSMDIRPHTHCPLCQPCSTCKKPKHVCAGHDPE